MLLLILHHSFQSICVPKCCSQKNRIQEQEVFGVTKREGTDCMLHSAVRQLEMEGSRNRGGKGPDQIKDCGETSC